MVGFASLLTIGIVSGCGSSQVTGSRVGGKEKTKSVELQLESAEYVLPERFGKNINDKILKVRVNLKNIGDKPFYISKKDFKLYKKDEEMKEYSSSDDDSLRSDEVDKEKKVSGSLYFDAKDASSYELVYKKGRQDPDEEEEEKITFKIDGKELAKKAKDLDKPAEALSAYINTTFYDKDAEKLKKLSGEDGQQYAGKVKKNFKTISMLGIYYDIDEQQFENYYKNLRKAVQKNTKFEAKAVAVSADRKTTEVELKVKPLMISEMHSKVDSEKNRILGENPNIEYFELRKKLFDYEMSILSETKTSNTEETITIGMKKHEGNQWRISDEYGNILLNAFIQ